jgi:glutamine synthetase
MNELDMELWKLGISAKTKHNEVAPNQYELAVVYGECNVTIDQNHLVMDVMKRVARRHKLVCLLHEKPFARVNGSGKHNNWSVGTDDGINLLSPGKTPEENTRFLLFIAAVLKAVDKHADLLRLSASTPGNDHRLGGNEAPPAIISVYLGHTLTALLDKIEAGEKIGKKDKEIFKLGVSALPDISRDDTDRNRTSPFAFTINKFEFRMVPSEGSLARANMILNTIIADVLGGVAVRLEKDQTVEEIIKEFYSKHKRVVFNGDGYSEDWHKEAKKRGLPYFSKSVDVYPELCSEKNVTLFERQKVLNTKELNARMMIFLEDYVMKNHIEANTMLVMAERQILPAVLKYQIVVAENAHKLASVGIDNGLQVDLLKELNGKLGDFVNGIKVLKSDIAKLESLGPQDAPRFTGDVLSVDMEELRAAGDQLEEICALEYWPMPTYADMLFKI